MKINIFNWNLVKTSVSKEILKKNLSKTFKDEIELNIVFVSKEEIKKLNLEHRGINKPTDILSFGPYEETAEIYISPELTKNLFQIIIHGILHIKGYDHSEEMFELEEKYLKKFCSLLN